MRLYLSRLAPMVLAVALCNHGCTMTSYRPHESGRSQADTDDDDNDEADDGGGGDTGGGDSGGGDPGGGDPGGGDPGDGDPGGGCDGMGGSVDECGVCDGDGSSCFDFGCDGAGGTVDACGICDGDGSSCSSIAVSWGGVACRAVCWGAAGAGCAAVGVACGTGTAFTFGGAAIPCSWATIAACTAAGAGASICSDVLCAP